MNITALYALFKSSKGIATDTRNTIKRKIYFALKGDHFDGNDFALDALAKGALAAVVDRPALKNKNDKFLFVHDVLKILQKLAHLHRKKCKTTIISITGSNTTINRAGTSIVSATIASSGGYLSKTVTFTIVVNRATPSLSFLDITKTYEDGGNFSLTTGRTLTSNATYSLVDSLGSGIITINGTGDSSNADYISVGLSLIHI